MAKNQLTELTVKVLLGLAVVEVLANLLFEATGRHHSTPAWLAAMISGCLLLILRATFKEKK